MLITSKILTRCLAQKDSGKGKPTFWEDLVCVNTHFCNVHPNQWFSLVLSNTLCLFLVLIRFQTELCYGISHLAVSQTDVPVLVYGSAEWRIFLPLCLHYKNSSMSQNTSASGLCECISTLSWWSFRFVFRLITQFNTKCKQGPGPFLSILFLLWCREED